MKKKFNRFLKLLLCLIQNAITTVIFIVLAHWLSLLLKHTVGDVGEKWGDVIVLSVFIVVSVIAALQFIVLTVFDTYKTLKEELSNENNESDNN